LALQAERLFGITCQVTCDRLPPMPDHTVATHLYRIAQEAVSNAVKHGQARHVVLALTTRQHSTTLTTHDDGIGFQEGAHKPTGGERDTVSWAVVSRAGRSGKEPVFLVFSYEHAQCHPGPCDTHWSGALAQTPGDCRCPRGNLCARVSRWPGAQLQASPRSLP